MKKIILILTVLCISITSFAQQDTSRVAKDSIMVERDNDTIRIGGMIILKNKTERDKRVVVTVGDKKKTKENNFISTSSWLFDIGFSNWTDKTNYSSNSSLVNRPGSPDLAENDLKLKSGKSVNVNIWLFMQKMNLIEHYVNLKYGLGVELNNYRFKSAISFHEGGLNPYNSSQNIPKAFIFRDSISFSKNKLAADYVTVTLMINFNTNPKSSRNSLKISAGVSMGYLYSSRNKQVSGERGKKKNGGDYDLDKWKFSYVGELGLGSINFYGTYTPKSIFTNDLNFTPYNIGIRIGKL
ncbi:MAG: hypothetical protein ABIN48_03710 [Ginsengibacter sp.]